MRVFSQINNCQQKRNKTKTKNKKTDETKRGALLLGSAKSIYYYIDKSVFEQRTTKKQEMTSSLSSLVRIWKIHHLSPGCSFP